MEPSRSPDLALLERFFERMVLIRAVEESLLDLFAAGAIRGTVHTCLGQEATAVGVVAALDAQRDVVCSNHRGHGHFLAYSEDAEGLIAEVLGLPSGVCGGIGGSQHVHARNFYSNGILGGMVPVAAGMALAEKLRGQQAVVAVFLGDGAFGEGVVYEALNMSSLWSLPIIFCVEHNQYAQSTPWRLEHGGDLSARARPFGIPVSVVDGNDVMEVHAAASAAVDGLRAGRGPHLLFMETYRMGPHSKGDDLRDPAEIAAHRKHEPLVRTRALLDPVHGAKLEQEVRQRVAGIVERLRRRVLVAS